MSSLFSAASLGRSTPIHWLPWILCITSWSGRAATRKRRGHGSNSERFSAVSSARRTCKPLCLPNLACVAAHEGKRDEAFSLLREAIDHGIPPSLDLGIENDSDLQSLHGDPRFDAIVAHAKERAAAAAKQQ